MQKNDLNCKVRRKRGKSMLYLSSIMDLYNSEIIAFTISDEQDLQGV